MQSVPRNLAVAEDAGYRVLATHTLPRTADGGLLRGAPAARRPRRRLSGWVSPELAAETIREIQIFSRSEDSYGYVFYVLQRA